MSACNKTDEKKNSVTKTTFEKYGNPYGIPWQKDLDTAFSKAKEEKKLVIVMAVSEGCKWCEKMKKETLSNPKVAKKLENYLLVMADRETPSEKNQLPPFNHVPIIFFMTHEKESLDNLRGFFNAEDFLEYLNDLEEE
jgi:thioredoxin-related protein